MENSLRKCWFHLFAFLFRRNLCFRVSALLNIATSRFIPAIFFPWCLHVNNWSWNTFWRLFGTVRHQTSVPWQTFQRKHEFLHQCCCCRLQKMFILKYVWFVNVNQFEKKFAFLSDIYSMMWFPTTTHIAMNSYMLHDDGKMKFLNPKGSISFLQ